MRAFLFFLLFTLTSRGYSNPVAVNFIQWTSLPTQQLNPVTDSLVWSYDSLLNQRNQQTLLTNGEFRVYGSDRIEWVQQNGTVEFVFGVTDASQNWSDALVPGSVTYNVTYEQSEGTITITRTASAIKLELNLTNPGRPNTSYVFSINQVQTLTGE